MKIIYHHRTQGKGVEAVHIMGIINGLRALGHEVTIVGPPRTDPERNVHSSSSASIKIVPWKFVSKCLPEIFFEIIEIFYNVYSVGKLYRMMSKGRFDVIYERYALFQFGGILAARMNNCPMILEINDAASVERVRPLVLKKLARALEKFIFDKADGLVAISGYFKQYIMSLGIDEQKITVIPNAVDPDIFNSTIYDKQIIRKKFGLECCFVIGFVGLFVPWHGITFLVEVYARVARKFPFIHLMLVGDGPERLLLEEQIRNAGISDRISITGYIPHDQVAAYMSCFDAAVMPNSNCYGSPMKIFEYMAMSIAIIAPSYTPITEILKNNHSALLFTPNNGQELVDALERLINDKNLVLRLGETARREIEEKHTWVINARRVENKICQALAS